MKRTIAVALALVLVVSLAGCSNNAEKLYGTWEMTNYTDQETIDSLLESFGFFPEEIALASDIPFGSVVFVEFTEENTYRFAFDVEKSEALAREFFVKLIDGIYEIRSELTDYYGEEIVEMPLDEFRLGYAALFDIGDYEELLDTLVSESLDYDLMESDLERGTYSVAMSLILCTIEGEDEAESLEYEINENTLKLIYVDGEEIYTKAE